MELRQLAVKVGGQPLAPHAQDHLSQILSLNHLAPSIQETLLFLPRTLEGADRVTEKKLRDIGRTIDWEAQRAVFQDWMAATHSLEVRKTFGLDYSWAGNASTTDGMDESISRSVAFRGTVTRHGKETQYSPRSGHSC